MRGYLVKRGHLRGNWLRRYVVLEGHILRWYDKPGGKVKGQVSAPTSLGGGGVPRLRVAHVFSSVHPYPPLRSTLRTRR